MMKKIVSILLIAVLALALSCAALADYSYNPETGKITGSYEGSGWVETYVNGAAAGGDKLSIDAVEGETYVIEVYENGALVDTATVVAEAPAPTDAPVEPTDAPVEPTDAPVEPTDAPVEPTDAPVEPTDAPVEPTDAPVEPTDAPVEPTDAPVEPTDAPVEPVDPTAAPEQTKKPAVDENGKDAVPKTGESDFVFVLLGAAALASIAVVVLVKKNAGKN